MISKTPPALHDAAAHIAEAEAYGEGKNLDGSRSYAAAFGWLSSALRGACAELARYTGKPEGMGNWVEKELDGATVLVDVEFEAGEAQTWEHPGCAAQATITGVLINGVVIDPAMLAPKVIADWEEELSVAMAEAAATDREDAVAEAAEREAA
jgi:hypothetical protein